jgi:uncharacterized membrane protein YphA (DoxX/SURF4 family)
MRAKLALALRIALGLVFCYAAYTKLRQPWLVFAMSIDAYRVLPPWAVFTVARTLPWMELVIGLLLISGFLLRYAAPAATILLTVFYAAMIHAYAAGVGIDCGCFGVGEAVSATTLLRDGMLLGCSLALSIPALRRNGTATARRDVLAAHPL